MSYAAEAYVVKCRIIFTPPSTVAAAASRRRRTQQVVNALYAGYDTTSTTIARVLQCLASADSEEVVHQLVNELNGNTATGESKLDEDSSSSMGTSAQGIFKQFPLLDAVVLEAGR